MKNNEEKKNRLRELCLEVAGSDDVYVCFDGIIFEKNDWIIGIKYGKGRISERVFKEQENLILECGKGNNFKEFISDWGFMISKSDYFALREYDANVFYYYESKNAGYDYYEMKESTIEGLDVITKNYARRNELMEKVINGDMFLIKNYKDGDGMKLNIGVLVYDRNANVDLLEIEAINETKECSLSGCKIYYFNSVFEAAERMERKFGKKRLSLTMAVLNAEEKVREEVRQFISENFSRISNDESNYDIFVIGNGKYNEERNDFDVSLEITFSLKGLKEKEVRRIVEALDFEKNSLKSLISD